MNKKLFLTFLFLIPSLIYAHILLLNVYDNENNTITVEGVFNTGELAIGAQINLESINTGNVLYKKRLPNEGKLIIDIPKEPYTIILNGGSKHIIKKEGISPKEGFSTKILKKKKAKLSSEIMKSKRASTLPIIMIGLVLAFLLLLVTIFISIKNTNRLIKELKEMRL